MAVSRRLRFEILRRDDYTCRYCGGKAPDVELRVDHVHPVALGGSDQADNLVSACKDCNAGKSSIDPDSPTVKNVANDAIRWARAIQCVMETYSEERLELDRQIEFIDEHWEGYGYTQDGERLRVPRPTDWPDTVERFLGLGLTQETLTHFIGVAMRKPGVPLIERWAYFCGCCWRTLDDVQAKAKQVIAFADDWEQKMGIG